MDKEHKEILKNRLIDMIDNAMILGVRTDDVGESDTLVVKEVYIRYQEVKDHIKSPLCSQPIDK